jgi:hypothetical protein
MQRPAKFATESYRPNTICNRELLTEHNLQHRATDRTQFAKDSCWKNTICNRELLTEHNFKFTTSYSYNEIKFKYRVIKNYCRDDQKLLAWPPRSPDATPRDFFLWCYVKDQVHVPPRPASIPELKVQIRTVNETITADMLQTFLIELDCCVDVCRITKGAHI